MSEAEEGVESEPLLALPRVQRERRRRALRDAARRHDDDVDFEFTYWAFMDRRWQRLSRGTYWSPQATSNAWLCLFGAVYLTYLLLQLLYFRRRAGYYLEFVLMGVVSLAGGLTIHRYRWLVRFVGLECYSFALFFFLLDLYSQPAKYLPLALGVIVSVTVTLVVFFVYPHLHRCFLGGTGAIVSRLVARDDATNVSTYEIDVRNWFSGQTSTSVYVGATRRGRPHGFGQWLDAGSAGGETLSGWFEDGVPIGPFESTENETRSVLANVRLMFATCIADDSRGLARAPLTYGVAGVEACISGVFFKNFPKVNMVKPAVECRCQPSRCVCISGFFARSDWRHLDEVKPTETVTVMVDKRNEQLLVSGHVSEQASPTSVTIELDVQREPERQVSLTLDRNWLSSNATEGLLYIHGVNHTVKDSLKRFAQFLALGSFPPHIKPFVFSWPSSENFLMYWCAQNLASDTLIHRSLLRMLLSMRAAGIRRLHIVCHSMGSRLFLRAWPILRTIFHRPESFSRSMSLDDLISAAAAAAQASQRAAEAAPARDNSVNASSEDEELVRSGSVANAVATAAQEEQPTPIELMNVILLNADYELDTFVDDCSDIRNYCSRVSVYVDNRDQAVRIPVLMTGLQSLGNIGRNFQPLRAANGELLDIDVVDTGDLDRNMHEQYHSAFNINRQLIDDLRDLIVFYRRAEERTSRLKRWSTGVYRFSTIPSAVNMI